MSEITNNLSDKKRELFEKLMRERKESKNIAVKQTIPRRQDTDTLALSFAQQRIWFLEQLESGSLAYNIPSALRLVGRLNVEALERSLNEVVKRHESLRTGFATVDGLPVQVIQPELKLTLPVIDLRKIPESEREAKVQQFAAEDNQIHYDLVNGPLLRGTLLQLSDEEHVMVMNMHHIISDGWSMRVLMSEMGAVYEAIVLDKPIRLPELPIQYPDYAIWQRGWMQGDVLKSQLKFWKEKLHGSRFVLELPVDHSRPPVQSFKGARQYLEISPELTKALNALAQKCGVTLFMVLMAAYKVLLYRYSGQGDILVGTPIAGRNREEFEGLIGFFVNTLVLRTDLSDNPTFSQLLERVSETTRKAFDNQELPFENLVEELQPQRDLSRNPIFQVSFGYQSEAIPPIKLPGLTITTIEIDSRTSKFDLELQLWKAGEGISGFFEYATDLYEQSTIARMAEHFIVLLESAATNPEQPVSAVNLLKEEQRQRILVEWNDTDREYPRNLCIHELFERQAALTPEAVAAEFEDVKITYGDLNIKANQLASYLYKLGVRPDALVGICMERSIEMLVTLLGILKAGGAYVPLDPAFPADRLSYMVEDAQMEFLLTQEKLKDMIAGGRAKTICIDSEWEKIREESISNPASGAMPENLAYVIYTSGSTGKPKGVQIPHRAVVNFLNSMAVEPGITAKDKLLSVTTLSFDIAALEIFLPITTGACVVIASRETATDGNRLIQSLNKRGITVMQATPATWKLMLEAGWQGNAGLKVLCGGEALPLELARQLVKRSGSLWNMYGPTETTIWSAVSKIEGEDTRISIGRPIDNTQIYILDASLQPVPEGITGELFIGGDGLSRGYLKRPELTEERFIPNPFVSGEGVRMYKTGDLARYRADGTIEVLGRADSQVKIRGFRIELGEIEAVMGKHPAVREVAVAAQEIEPGDFRLIAYYVCSEEQAPANSEFRSFLKDALPDYMVPSAFVVMEAMPLTPNGKLDRRALPVPGNVRGEVGAEYVAPAGEMEKTIATVWQEVLKLDKVGINDNFFDLGGHSLLMTQVNSRLRELLKVEISVIDMFKYPTIGSLAKFLSREGDEKASFEKAVESAKARRESAGKNDNDVAIIGVSLRFPGANTAEEYWDNLRDGVESISFFTDEEILAAGTDPEMLKDPNFVKAEAIIEDVDLFDAAFFGYSPEEAETLDPQLRFLIECSWEALERAGYNSEGFDGHIGFFGGSAMPSYMLTNLSSGYSAHGVMANYKQRMALLSANSNDFLAQRVSYNLKLDGPSVNVQTACSTSMVAIHLASQGLIHHECDMALAGAVAIRVPQKVGYLYQEGGLPSPDGHCRPFDAKGKGTVHSNGIAMVVLKRLSDAVADGDNIYAVIKGSAVNNDGALKVGFMAPSVDGQSKVIAQAQAAAGVNPGSITYVEAFGTATEIGDSLEVEGLTQAFRLGTQDKSFCGLGSVKSNLGHLDHASGIAGIIKTALALKHKMLPPSINFEEPNPKIDFKNTPFYVCGKLADWNTDRLPRRAGVSNFAIGGTNVHAVLEEAPEIESSEVARSWQLIALSAKTGPALETYTSNLASFLKKNPDVRLADAAFTLQVGRKAFNHRRIVVCNGAENAVEKLEKLNLPGVLSTSREYSGEVFFLLEDSGWEILNAGLELYGNEPVFKENIDTCAEIIKSYTGTDIRTVLYPGGTAAQVKQAELEKPIVFAIEYVLARLWVSWGLKPKGIIGQGVGEYAAACLSKVMSIEDALLLLASKPSKEITLSAPSIPLLSNGTGKWMTAQEATKQGTWTDRACNTDKFNEGLKEVLKAADRVLLVMGPKASLGLLAEKYYGQAAGDLVISSLGGDSDEEQIVTALGRCWLAGVRMDWKGFHAGEQRKRVVLPTYPFERKRHWIGASQQEETPKEAGESFAAPGNELEKKISGVWRELLNNEQIGINDSFFALGGDTALATRAVNRLRELLGIELSVGEFIELKNIKNLAAAVERKRAEQTSASEMEDLLEGLSEEELKELMDAMEEG